MQNYELLLILPGTLSEDEVEPLIEKVNKTIEEVGGSNLSVEKLEKRRLAYPIKHIRYGYFNLVYFDAEPSVAVDIQKKLLLIPDLLRVLVKKYDPNKQKSRTIEFGLPMGGQNREEFSNSNREKESEPVYKKEKVEEKDEEVGVEVVLEEATKEEKVEEKPTKKEVKKGKVNIEDIDKKLDEILDMDLSNV